MNGRGMFEISYSGKYRPKNWKIFKKVKKDMKLLSLPNNYPRIQFLDTLQPGLSEQVGGKGDGLAKLIVNGFNVPKGNLQFCIGTKHHLGFCITTRCYLEHVKSSPQLDQLISKFVDHSEQFA